jgi:hypothetical protein
MEIAWRLYGDRVATVWGSRGVPIYECTWVISALTADCEDSESVRANSRTTTDAPETIGDALWLELCAAPEEGTDVGELMRITGWERAKLYRHLREHAEAGRAIRVSGGCWRARAPEDRSP